MTLIVKTLVGAFALALVIAAAPASASVSTSKGETRLSDVRAELQEASAALDQIWGDDSADDFADDPDDDFGDDDEPGDEFGDDFTDDDGLETVNLDAVAANLEHTAVARQLASRVKPRKNRAGAIAAVAQQADDNVFEYADDIGWVDADQQPTFVSALVTSLNLRAGTIGPLVAGAAKLPESARGKVLATVSDALSDGDPEVLLDTLAEEDGYGATAEVKQTVVTPLAGLIDETGDVAHDLRDLAASLPADERRDVRDAADAVEGQLDDLPDYVDELFADFEDYDDPAAGAAAFCGYLAQLPLPTASACG